MSIISNRVKDIKPSPTLAITAKAIEMRANGIDIISMAGGEPDYATPTHICQAAHKAIDEGKHKYTAVDGIVELRQAIQAKFKRDNNLDYGLDQLLVSPGGKMICYAAMMATLNKGDEVIIPAPYWVSYPDIVLLAEGTPVFIKCGHEAGFKMTPDQLESAITPRTKWLFLNSPSNPTGAVYSRDELAALGDVLKKHPHVHVFTDDIYEALVYDDQPFSTIAEVCPELYDRTIILQGASKAYAMTGWRLGYGAGPVEIIKKMKTILSQSTSNTCAVTQHAGVAALNGDQSFLKDWRNDYQHRRDELVKRLNSIDGLSVESPKGAFYVFVNCQGLIGRTRQNGQAIETDLDVAAFFLEDCEVAVTPGTVFGLSPYVRMSYATAYEDLMRACDRFEAGIARLS